MFKKFVKKYIIKNFGTTRIVFIFKSLNIVIKIPNFTYSMQNFLLGMFCNWNERIITKQFKEVYDKTSKNNSYDKIAPTYFCAWFGLFTIQRYCKPINLHLDIEKINEDFKLISGDITYRNMGYLIHENGQRLVCIDYGQQ